MVWGSFILSSVVSMQLCVLQTRWCVEEPALSLCSFLSMAWTQVPWIQVTDWLVRIKRHWVDKVRANTRRWSVANPVILAMSPNWFPISSSPRECFSSVTKVTMHTGMSNCIGISNSDPRTRALISRHPLPILIVINGLFVMRCDARRQNSAETRLGIFWHCKTDRISYYCARTRTGGDKATTWSRGCVWRNCQCSAKQVYFPTFLDTMYRWWNKKYNRTAEL